MAGNPKKPIIAIITSTKVTTFMSKYLYSQIYYTVIFMLIKQLTLFPYTGSVQIGTLPSTHLYINLDDESVIDMRQR